ncbi:hypothetical protein KUTeg_017048 [Tegillarca granosa]|uniref:HTH CENPB-type domain-containing protein n=1 Tax=Tegillarca granosa TaxID=220873 RepID=A0ABQ9EMN9_TEGGR|nr:hypothetical protein KUTeg_017048 [Tegillarca granosa]
MNSNPGPKTLLTYDEELKLKHHVEYMAELGYGYARGDFLDISSDYSHFLGKTPSGFRLSKKWYSGFMKRWPDLKLKTPRKLAIQRAECTSKETINKYYKELGTIMTQYSLHDKPENIYNIDETGFSTEHNPSKVVCNINLKVQAITSPRGSNVTVIGSGNALGTSLPPYYIFPGKKWNPNFLEGTPTGSNGECTESGWSNSALSGSAYTKAMTPSNLCSSFRKTGIFPFKHTVPESAMKPATLYTINDNEPKEIQTTNDNITTTACDHENTQSLLVASNKEKDEIKQTSPSIFLNALSITSETIKKIKSNNGKKRDTITGNIGKRKNVQLIHSSAKKQKMCSQTNKRRVNREIHFKKKENSKNAL